MSVRSMHGAWRTHLSPEIELIKREWAEEDIDATMAMAIVMAGVEVYAVGLPLL